jgi:hypothetical protein
VYDDRDLLAYLEAVSHISQFALSYQALLARE